MEECIYDDDGGGDGSGGGGVQCKWMNCRVTLQTPYLALMHLYNEHSAGQRGPRDSSCRWNGCKKKPKGMAMLREHMRIHAGVPAFVCPHPGCERVLGSILYLRNHVESTSSHSALAKAMGLTMVDEDKRYPCPHKSCVREFSSIHHLKFHLMRSKAHNNLKNNNSSTEVLSMADDSDFMEKSYAKEWNSFTKRRHHSKGKNSRLPPANPSLSKGKKGSGNLLNKTLTSNLNTGVSDSSGNRLKRKNNSTGSNNIPKVNISLTSIRGDNDAQSESSSSRRSFVSMVTPIKSAALKIFNDWKSSLLSDDEDGDVVMMNWRSSGDELSDSDDGDYVSDLNASQTTIISVNDSTLSSVAASATVQDSEEQTVIDSDGAMCDDAIDQLKWPVSFPLNLLRGQKQNLVLFDGAGTAHTSPEHMIIDTHVSYRPLNESSTNVDTETSEGFPETKPLTQLKWTPPDADNRSRFIDDTLGNVKRRQRRHHFIQRFRWDHAVSALQKRQNNRIKNNIMYNCAKFETGKRFNESPNLSTPMDVSKSESSNDIVDNNVDDPSYKNYSVSTEHSSKLRQPDLSFEFSPALHSFAWMNTPDYDHVLLSSKYELLREPGQDVALPNFNPDACGIVDDTFSSKSTSTDLNNNSRSESRRHCVIIGPRVNRPLSLKQAANIACSESTPYKRLGSPEEARPFWWRERYRRYCNLTSKPVSHWVRSSRNPWPSLVTEPSTVVQPKRRSDKKTICGVCVSSYYKSTNVVLSPLHRYCRMISAVEGVQMADYRFYREAISDAESGISFQMTLPYKQEYVLRYSPNNGLSIFQMKT